MSDGESYAVASAADLIRHFGGWVNCPDCGGMADVYQSRLMCGECGRLSNAMLTVEGDAE